MIPHSRGYLEVHRVANQAIKNMNLPRNQGKGGWNHIPRLRLFWLLIIEVYELACALLQLYRLERQPDCPMWTIKSARRHVEHEAGDCLSYLAMLVDVTGK